MTLTKKVAFLLSDTGGGHRAAADAINEALQKSAHYHYNAYLDDIWQQHTPYPLNQIPKAYPWLVGQGLPIWRLIWRFSTPHNFYTWLIQFALPIVKRKMVAYLQKINPDIIVSVHPLMNHIGLQATRLAGLRVPFLTVVTDMVTVHPAWICPNVTHCMVATEPARQRAIHYGLSPTKITVTGQPVSLKFTQLSQNKALLRQIMALEPQRHTILIIGGGEGVGPIFEIGRAIARALPMVQMLIVTGRNQRLRYQLEQVNWEVPTRIYGFVDNIPELMACADLLITKAGPSTISEACISRLPMILSSYIPGQETGNVYYVQENKIGVFAPNPVEVVAIINRWINDKHGYLQQMAKNAAAIARPEATLTIADKISSLINSY
jgi:1,2-diacylglycerol 3-beta-galactosyltransferase